MGDARTRRLRVVAQDPGVRVGGAILTDTVRVLHEDLEPGPTGHRVRVVDYDSSSGTFYRPAVLRDGDPDPTDEQILGDPAFHAQNVYALVSGTLARFESALGRRAEWGFASHQLTVVPHAFEIANAYYSPRDEALLFGYTRRRGELVHTCLSHDIVVHETTHALVDGLRRGFMRPSSPDQAAFHEGFADVVALLSVFTMGPVLAMLVTQAVAGTGSNPPAGLVATADLTEANLRASLLFGLADDMAPQLSGATALRRSVDLRPDPGILRREEYREPHKRGEVLVAAVMNAFLAVWARRLHPPGEGAFLAVDRAAEEGAEVAQQLLTAAIRALDYTPPIHLSFGEFLAALLTADTEVRDDDSRYGLRAALRTAFGAYGITVPEQCDADGLWRRSEVALTHDGIRFGSLRTDPTEMFRLLWSNRKALRLLPPAYTYIASVRPCLRTGPEDGLPVQETVAECRQYLKIPAPQLARFGLRRPTGMPDDLEVPVEGGSTLVLDEYGALKYQIHNPVPRNADPTSVEGAQAHLDYLWDNGFLDEGASIATRLSSLHRRRALGTEGHDRREQW